jgi:hypothetical protein
MNEWRLKSDRSEIISPCPFIEDEGRVDIPLKARYKIPLYKSKI